MSCFVTMLMVCAFASCGDGVRQVKRRQASSGDSGIANAAANVGQEHQAVEELSDANVSVDQKQDGTSSKADALMDQTARAAGHTYVKQAGLGWTTGNTIGTWRLIFRQTYPGLFVANEWSRNPGDPTNNNYAILDQLESFRGYDGKFEFKLVWPSSGLLDQRWKQTSNPVTRLQHGVEGYEAISVPYAGAWWGGLEYNGNFGALLDGSVDNGNYWAAVGSLTYHSDGYPGPGTSSVAGTKVSSTELYVRQAQFVIQAPGSNVCEIGTTPMTLTECQLAAALLGKTFAGVVEHSPKPAACSEAYGEVGFNIYADGSPHADYAPVCRAS